MNKRIMYMTAIFLAATGINTAVAQTDAPLICRGPLRYIVGIGKLEPGIRTTAVYFIRNPKAAGGQGAFLLPRTCAWSDRPVAETEPNRITFESETATKIHSAFVAFTACAWDSRCVVVFSAHNANRPKNPHFIAQPRTVKIYYPKFPPTGATGN